MQRKNLNPVNSFAHFRSAATRLDGALSQCAAHPSAHPVHRLRTGTRRVEAALETLRSRQIDGKNARRLRKTAASLDRLLRKMRRRAGAVRDADVHLEMLRNLRRQALAQRGRNPLPSSRSRHAASELLRECRIVEAELAHRRTAAAARLQQHAARWQPKLAARAEAVLVADPGQNHSDSGPDLLRDSAGALALASFARLCRRMPELHTRNLHDFRKGAKRARYQAEAGEDACSRRIALQLKRLQDAIGLWHDWLALADEARAAVEPSSPLLRRLETLRDRHYRVALRTAQQMRLRLLAADPKLIPAPRSRHRHAA